MTAVGALAGAVGLLRVDADPRPAAAWLPGSPTVTASPATSPPTRLRIAAIGVDTPLMPLHLDLGGRLTAPSSFEKAGWYAEGTAPGEPGPAVIAGHVDSIHGKAVFFRLRQLRPGDRVEVLRGSAWVGFVVTAVHQYAKSAFPTGEVYGPTPDAQLRLITCGGDFDRAVRSYEDNVVVSAVMT
ncbi:MAG: class F sortase [Hamadaea sp.]|nr:class F sortase [Hamadaea sp.]NUT19107.1 class F sortase [Hamadaea sp.]